jgi:hypothetical protein
MKVSIPTMTEEFSVPTLAEIERGLLTELDERIARCQRLKAHVIAARGTPVNYERIREWRQQAKVDRMSEACLRTCRRLYGRLLKPTDARCR